MSTKTLLPDVQAPVQLTTADGRVGPARVDAAEGPRLTLSATGLPAFQVGDPVMVRWPAGPRGRYVQTATVVGTPGADRAVVELRGTPEIEQLRRFVRGGGGETIRLRRYESNNAAQFGGFVQDLSERSVRARCEGLRAEAGEPVWAEIYLDDQLVEVSGTVLSAAPTLGGSALELVVVFEPVEAVARLIRRYVLQQQVLARRTATG